MPLEASNCVLARHRTLSGQRWEMRYIEPGKMTVDYLVYPEMRIIAVAADAPAITVERAWDDAADHALLRSRGLRLVELTRP